MIYLRFIGAVLNIYFYIVANNPTIVKFHFVYLKGVIKIIQIK